MKRWKMATAVIAAFLLSLPLLDTIHAQQMVFPGIEWDGATPKSQHINSVRLNAAVEYLGSDFGGGSRDLAIIRNGRLIWESADVGRVRHVYSVGKSFTSTVLGLLIDDGRANIDMRAADYVPSLATDYSNVTLRHFATMTSGYHAEGEQGLGLLSDTPFTPEHPYYFPPGSHYFYSQTAMEQFSNTLTQIAEEPIEDLFRRRIADPIGMSNWYWKNWVDDVPSPANPPDSVAVVNKGTGGIDISALEAARLGHLFLNQGQWDGQQLISAEWIAEATSVQVPASIPVHSHSTYALGPGIYGYNWWPNGIRPSGIPFYPGAPPGTYCASGNSDNRIFVVPEWNMVVTKTSTAGSANHAKWGEFLYQVGNAELPNNGVTLDVAPAAVYATIDDTLDHSGDRTVNVDTDSWVEVGEVDKSDRNYVSRATVKFALPDALEGQPVLQKATLGLRLFYVDESMPWSLSVFHSQSDNDTDLLNSDYEDATYVDIAGDFIQPSDKRFRYYDLDVTDLVQADYAADGIDLMSAFRLQLDDLVFHEDNIPHRYFLSMPGDTARPQLLLTFIPEPSSIMLSLGFTFCGLAIAHCRRRRSYLLTPPKPSPTPEPTTADCRLPA